MGSELEGGVHTFMIIEMRTYRTKPGKRDDFVRVFRTKSVPAHLEMGMKVLGPFLSVEDPDVFFFMRGFHDIESRDSMRKKFYESELWKRELEAVLLPMLEKYEVVLVDDPDAQIRW
jgi:NIPSNAP